MKAEILKIAGVKTEKEFYSKYPTQEAFMKKHAKEFDKIQKAQNGTNSPSFSNDLEGYDPENNYNKVNKLIRPEQFNDSASFIPSAGKNPYFNQNKQNAYENRMQGQIIEDPNSVDSNSFDFKPYISGATDVVSGIGMIKGQKNKVKEAKQNSILTGVQADAAGTRDVDSYNMLSKQRRGLRPEDNVFTGEEFFPVNGVGTNVLAKNGKGIKKAQFGSFLDQGGDKLLEKISGGLTNRGEGPDAGSTIGGGIGEITGNAFLGPVGGIVGKFAGKAIGGLIDNSDQKIKKYNNISERNITKSGLNSVNMSNQFMRDGGEISSLEQQGDLHVGDEGEAELISYNPYMPESGETVMFNGPSHENGGIDMNYDGTQVEVEGREPAQIIEDPLTKEKELVISGNLVIPKNILGDKNADGKKFKNYIKDLSKQEVKQNKILDNSMKNLNELNPNDSFDKITLSSYEAMSIGANLKLKDIAEKKKNAAFLQKAINESASEFGLDADYLAKGKHKPLNMDSLYARDGKNIAQNGAEYAKKHGLETWKGNVSKGNKYGKKTASSFSLEEWGTIAENLGFEGQGNEEFQQFLSENEQSSPLIKKRHTDLYQKEPFIDGKLGYGWEAAELKALKKRVAPSLLSEVIVGPQKKEIIKKIDPNEGVQPNNNNNPYITALNSLIPNFRGTDAEGLNPRQLAGEMFALSNNQLEPVEAQLYQPQLDTPYDISYQDQLNENQSDFRSTQKLTNNPAVLSSLNAQKYAANSRVLGEQFRANQGMKDKVYSGNRATLNDAQLKNLNILDNQFTRQSEAKSNTKAVTQAALMSISDKYSQNALENKKLQVYENLYNYRYGEDMKLQNLNGLATFTTPSVGTTGVTNELGDMSEEEIFNIKKYRADKSLKEAKKAPKGRNGAIINAMKLSNFSS